MAGLGRQVASTGMLAQDAIDKALSALVRFRILCEAMHVGQLRVIATAAARYASNGPDFIARAEAAVGQIGRASWRERGKSLGVAGPLTKKSSS